MLLVGQVKYCIINILIAVQFRAVGDVVGDLGTLEQCERFVPDMVAGIFTFDEVSFYYHS